MKYILFAAVVGLGVSILLTPYLIKVFTRLGQGQMIREDGPQHQAKSGTPTMGGLAIIAAMWVGYGVSVTISCVLGSTTGPTVSGLLLLFLVTGLGLVGFLDDFLKLRNRRNLGLNKRTKLAGQTIVALVFAVAVLFFPDRTGTTPGSRYVSAIRDVPWLYLGAFGAVLLVVLIIAAWSNAVNFTDGLDGLAAGSSVMVLGSYVLIGFFQFRYNCADVSPFDLPGCYVVRDPLDLATIAAAALGGCIGFLWWNAHPARIFMGDTGSLAIGGLIAGLSVLTRTEVLLVVIAGLFVLVMISDIIQIVVFRTTKRRFFRMAPLHHHFEMLGWSETTILIRFWLLAVVSAAAGVGLFYADWLSRTGY